MKTTLIFIMLLLYFSVFSQDIYFGNGENVSIAEKVIFEGNLKIETGSNVKFKPTTKAKFNQNFEVVSGSVDSDGKFMFENTSQKTIVGDLIVDTISILSNSKLSIVNASTFRANDMLEIDGSITTGSKLVVLGESSLNPGVLNYSSGYIDGNFKRWFASSVINDVLFPFGSSSYYSPSKISYTVAPNGGSLTGKYILNTNSVYSINLTDGSELLENLSGDGFWQIDQTDGMNSGTYSIDLTTNNLVGVTDPSVLHLVKRPTSSDAWNLNWVTDGTHVQSSASGSFFSVYRTNLTSFSQFGIASPIVNPLPIEMVYFDGICEDNYTLLKWQTASEYNTTKFIIEKSEDGNTWLNIGEVAAAGNSSAILNYDFNDLSRSSFLTYYRLKQVDFDGAFKLFGPIANNCSNEVETVTVFPNPFVNSCIVNLWSKENDTVSIEVIDNLGKTLETIEKDLNIGKNEIYLDLIDYSIGVYNLKIKLNKSIYNKNIIKS
jgi:hypothetical protein